MKVSIVLALATLIVGGGIGYLIGASQNPPEGSTVQAPSSSHGTTADSMVAELSKLLGSNRDEAYLESMIIHHQSAVTMSQVLLETTNRPELKQLAENIITTQNAEIAQMQAWLSQWYGR